MKYYTKEYREALHNTELVEGFEILDEENVSINTLYEKREREYIERERELHDTPPKKPEDLFSELSLVLEDILVVDLDESGNEVNARHPESMEEWEAYKEASFKRSLEEFERREPFNEKEARECFKINFDIAVRDRWQMPKWVYEEVDPRLIALYYIPKEKYNELRSVSEYNEKYIKEIDEKAEKVLSEQEIPEGILSLLDLQDASLLNIEEHEGTITLEVLYEPGSSRVGKCRLIFKDAEFLENEIDKISVDEEGNSNTYFINQEIYSLGDSYEFHFLLDSYEDDRIEEKYLTIKAKNLETICLEGNDKNLC
ncbi:hypothetical protein [Guggenheimella bovis]